MRIELCGRELANENKNLGSIPYAVIKEEKEVKEMAPLRNLGNFYSLLIFKIK